MKDTFFSRLALAGSVLVLAGCSSIPTQEVARSIESPPTCDASPRAATYSDQFKTMAVRNEPVDLDKPGQTWVERRDELVKQIKANQGRYELVSSKTNLPWQVVAVLHAMESTLDFNANLLNGEPYSRKTEYVPKGRGPWANWEDAAVEGIQEIAQRRLASKLELDKPEVIACVLELYNGAGYIKKGMPSPYLWSGTQHYEKGKFVEKRWFIFFGPTYVAYEPELRSKQFGAMPLLAELMK